MFPNAAMDALSSLRKRSAGKKKFRENRATIHRRMSEMIQIFQSLRMLSTIRSLITFLQNLVEVQAC
jgi:hypothetical protein